MITTSELVVVLLAFGILAAAQFAYIAWNWWGTTRTPEELAFDSPPKAEPPADKDELASRRVARPTIIDDQKLIRWFNEQKCCPDCGCERFIEGPSGGLATNVLCPDCHSEFNIAPGFFAHRNGKPGQGRLEVFGVRPRAEG